MKKTDWVDSSGTPYQYAIDIDGETHVVPFEVWQYIARGIAGREKLETAIRRTISQMQIDLYDDAYDTLEAALLREEE